MPRTINHWDGNFDVKRGYYAYVGSAFGPGGLAARLKQHRSISANPHWHIDYLRRAAALVDSWISAEPDRTEHAWAEKLATLEAGQNRLPDAALRERYIILPIKAGAPAGKQHLKP